MSCVTCYNYSAWNLLAWWMYILVQSGLFYSCNLYVGVSCTWVNVFYDYFYPIFLNIRIFQRHIDLRLHRYSSQVAVIFVRFLPNPNFSTDFSGSPQHKSRKSLQRKPLCILIFYKSHTTHCFIIVFFTWRVVSALNVGHHRTIVQGQENIQKLCVHRVSCDLKF